MRVVQERYGDHQALQTWDACQSAMVFGNNSDAAQQQFEEGLRHPPEGQEPLDVQIKSITAAQFPEQLLTEAGGKPLVWTEIAKEMGEQLESTSADDFEQGYWVDVETAIPPGELSPNVETLQRDLPEDLREGLNWSKSKQFLYLITALTPPSNFARHPDIEDTDDLSNESPLCAILGTPG